MSAAPFCRDCLAAGPAAGTGSRCKACGSPRLLRHPERDQLAVAHIDCDAFFANIEKRDDPSLRDKPVIVGGRERGVVAAACYVARTYGIRSAMPMFKALQACPHAVVLRPDLDKYRVVGRQVRERMLELTPLVEPVSIDEAFLDLTGTERLHGTSPAITLARFAHRLEREIGISVSVGLAPNKFLAKIASDQDKPRGFFIIGRAEARAFLAERSVGLIPGVGARMEARLREAGITLIRHLAERSPADLMRIIGREGPRLGRMALGEDDRPVKPERETKSVSAETTFSQDLATFEEMQPILWRLCERVSGRLKQAGLAGSAVTLKLKDSRFRLTTRTRSGLPPTQLAQRLFAPARDLLREETTGTAFRLIGIGASELCPAEDADRGDLADPHVQDQARMEAALDRIRGKFGSGAVQRGLAFPWTRE